MIFCNSSLLSHVEILIFSRLRDTIKESWAEREGFSSFLEADEYFSRFYGSDWQVKEYACVKFVLQEN